MKAIGLILFVALALGCAHSDNQTSNDKLPTKIPHIHPGYVYLTKEDRAPAEAPVLKWRPATASLEVTSDAARGTKQVEVNQEMIWKELEYYNDTRMEYQEIDVLGSCSDFVCSKASGQSAAWDKYFAAPRERKAAALNEAIQGIGEVSATNLVAKGYFRAKPTSWTEFSDVLKRAADAGVIKKSVATNVLTNYRYENISNLGYAQGTCKEVVRQCTVTISKLEPVTFRNSRIVEKRKILEENTKKFDVNIEVLGALLLPTEKDVVTLEINENGAVALQDSNGNNRYSIVAMDVQGKVINVQVKADSRVLRNLSNNFVRQDSYKLIGDKATFILDVDPAFVPGQEDPNSQLVIDYIVHVCEYGWTGTCGFSSWKSLKMDSATITTSRTILTIDVPKKNKSEIVYTITRKNSRFFNDKSTSSRSTENVKMPK